MFFFENFYQKVPFQLHYESLILFHSSAPTSWLRLANLYFFLLNCFTLITYVRLSKTGCNRSLCLLYGWFLWISVSMCEWITAVNNKVNTGKQSSINTHKRMYFFLSHTHRSTDSLSAYTIWWFNQCDVTWVWQRELGLLSWYSLSWIFWGSCD